MSRKIAILVILVLIAVGTGYWHLKNKNSAPAFVSREFVGQVTKVDGSALIVEGVFVVADHPELQSPDHKKTVTVLVDQNGSKTEIIKEKLYLPSVKELQKTNGRYDPSKLKRDNVEGSLNDLKDGGISVSVTVTSQSNIYGKSSFSADEIRYIEPVYPQ